MKMIYYENNLKVHIEKLILLINVCPYYYLSTGKYIVIRLKALWFEEGWNVKSLIEWKFNQVLCIELRKNMYI